MTQFIFVMAAVFSVLLWRMYRRHHHAVMQARTSLLSQSSQVIDIKKTVDDRAGFRHLVGEYAGNTVSLKLEVDNLTARKLPVMWLHITMLRPMNSEGSLDILVRPHTSDVFSPGWNWNAAVTPLKNWPEHARYVSRDRAPSLQMIDNDVRTIFTDQRAKELLITPGSVRLTYLIRQAERGQYLLLRSAEFDMQPIDPADIEALTRQLEKLLGNLDGVQCDEAA
ncbi:MAG: hypothetical protein WEB02_05055 [Methylophaga sp.]